ncbi:MAG: acyl-CoA carboxylase subunit beta [Chloroflexi bacterium]|jgi:propionyl-CoA carboxylase beta chain|nr:acyl-CoA carboxylase subunit beta [Anaerolineaceae bacterium]NLI44477.1 acyl-CoA carboxylase subunit beta [Chloroflexota bacterium]HOE34854.1 acyl-CoA carboxylase subunit beta [Anaerolineaceae bacterium]HOT25976.1 acyl-CoA carboxylase subunit beta [Anaerolineaceae bacterium]HQK04040.1 acyl-CoA carboxylase subunit beta [Anaerolineaceae bacterium]
MTEADPRLEQLRKISAEAMLGGGQARIDKQHAKGSLTARERIQLLLDEGSFRELEALVVQQNDPQAESTLGDGVVTGYGKVDGRLVYVYAQDFTVQGGALGEMHSRKICRVMDLAAKNGAPIIGMIDSGGARIQEGVKSLGGYAEIFRRNAQYSGVVPQISLIMGPCAGGAAYSPALTDLIIMVQKQSYMFLTGPQVIKTVTGEDVDFESLGGADVHLGISGTAHLVTPGEREALALCRKVLGYLPANNVDSAPVLESGDSPTRRSEALNSLVPLNPDEPYSLHTAIQEIVDRGSFLEIQAGFAPNAIVGLARLDGKPVGIISQEPASMAGVMDIDSADKISRMVRFCDAFNLPIITFVDSPGFLPGVDQEHRGVIRHGAKVLFAYSEASVPKVSVVTRKAYGGAYVVMSSKFLGTDITYAWPSAEIAVMGAEGAANILHRKQISEAEDPAAERKRLEEEYRQKYLNPYAAARAGYIDEVIEPAQTRQKLIEALESLENKVESAAPRKHGNIPL